MGMGRNVLVFARVLRFWQGPGQRCCDRGHYDNCSLVAQVRSSLRFWYSRVWAQNIRLAAVRLEFGHVIYRTCSPFNSQFHFGFGLQYFNFFFDIQHTLMPQFLLTELPSSSDKLSPFDAENIPINSEPADVYPGYFAVTERKLCLRFPHLI